MQLKDVSLRGPKRSFVVESINNGSSAIARFEATSIVKIVTESASAEGQTNGGRLQVLDVAGMDAQLSKLNKFLSKFDASRVARSAGPPNGAIILNGAPGTGKSLLMNKIANTGWGKVFRITRGMKPLDVRQAFREAKSQQPSVITIDDLETLVSKDVPTGQTITDNIGEELDSLYLNQVSLPKVLVVASTSELSELPRKLRARGRFRTVIDLSVPDTNSRKQILQSLSKEAETELAEETLEKLGERTHAYVGGDLAMLMDQARWLAEDRMDDSEVGEADDKLTLTQDDIDQALLIVRPSAMHDVVLEPPKVLWDEIGGQNEVKKALRRVAEQSPAVCQPKASLINFLLTSSRKQRECKSLA
jgi:AAA family ATPase